MYPPMLPHSLVDHRYNGSAGLLPSVRVLRLGRSLNRLLSSQLLAFLLAVVSSVGCSQKPPAPDIAPADAAVTTAAPAVTPTVTPAAAAKDVMVLKPRARFTIAPTEARKSDDGPGVSRLFLSADGKRLAVSIQDSRTGATSAEVWDIAGQPKRLSKHARAIDALSPEGMRVVRRCEAGTQEVAEAATGRRLADLPVVGNHVFFRNPTIIISLNRSADWQKAHPLTVREFDAITGLALGSFVTSDDDRVNVAPLINQGYELALGVERANRFQVWDLLTRKSVRQFLMTPEPSPEKSQEIVSWNGFAVSPDGRWVAVRQGSLPLQIHDGITGAIVATLPVGVNGFHSVFLPDRPIYLTPSNITRADVTGTSVDVVAYDIPRKSLVGVFRGHEKPGIKVAVSADGTVLVTGDETGNVLLWNLAELR